MASLRKHPQTLEKRERERDRERELYRQGNNFTSDFYAETKKLTAIKRRRCKHTFVLKKSHQGIQTQNSRWHLDYVSQLWLMCDVIYEWPLSDLFKVVTKKCLPLLYLSTYGTTWGARGSQREKERERDRERDRNVKVLTCFDLRISACESACESVWVCWHSWVLALFNLIL